MKKCMRNYANPSSVRGIMLIPQLILYPSSLDCSSCVIHYA